MPPSEIDALLAKYPQEVQALATAARTLLESQLPDVTESVDMSAGLIGFGYGPGYKGLVCTLIMSRNGVKLGIVRGVELPDPNGLMSGSGKVHRHVALRSAADLNRPGLKALLRNALKAWRTRTGASSRAP